MTIMRPADTSDLTPEQQARLAYALTLIRATQTLRGWSQRRFYWPDGALHTVRLLKRHPKTRRLEQAYTVVCPDVPLH